MGGRGESSIRKLGETLIGEMLVKEFYESEKFLAAKKNAAKMSCGQSSDDEIERGENIMSELSMIFIICIFDLNIYIVSSVTILLYS